MAAFSQERVSARKRGYDTRWDKARKAYLRKHPLCTMCQAAGVSEAARVVDHIRPHRGDTALFWDSANWQPLCKAHHDRTKQVSERRGFEVGVDVAGRPLDAAHPWNRAPAG